MIPLEAIGLTIAFVLLLLFITVRGNLESNGKALERVERKLDLVIKHLGIEGPAAEGVRPEALSEIDRCIWSDRRIEAIKLYREETGADLVDAKEWVDRRTESF